MNNNYKFGFYGKLPFYADFLHLSNNEKLVEEWEKWAQQTLHKSQQIHGKDYWLEQYVKSPVWQFMLTPGVINDSAYIGVMIPSVDSVGRYYPFMFYIKVVSNDLSSLLVADLSSWLAEIQDYILQILELDTYSFEELKRGIIDISNKYIDNNDSSDVKQIQEDYSTIVFSHSKYHHQQTLTQLQFITMLSCHNQSIWWCDETDTMKANSAVITGMPSARVYLAMLNGNWETYGITPFAINPTSSQNKNPEIELDSVSKPACEVDTCCESEELDISSDPTIDLRQHLNPKVSSQQIGLNDSTKAHAISHKGHLRELNEDSFLNESYRNLWVVADGMGGHANGDYASGKLVEALAATPLSNDFDTAFDLINQAVSYANRKLYEYSDETIGTTLSLLYICDNRALCVWAGDSRIYLIDSRGILKQITKDHCVDGESGYESNILTRAVGADETVELDQVIVDLEQGDRLFLCSDGVYGEIAQGQIANTLHNGLSSKHACEDIIEQVLQTEAKDNLTAIVVDV